MKQQLKRELLPRHVQLMAMGGMIGTGIFKGSADTISAAGPGIVLAYIFAGILLFIVMTALAEMALAYPGRNLQGLVHLAFGSRVSFLIGWLYWLQWVLVIVVEVLAGASFLQYWLPAVPLWLLHLLCAALILSMNVFSVKLYGEVEFWLASIKIATLIVFIVLGGALLFGLFPGHEGMYLQNYTGHGGFLPKGWSGVFTSLLLVVFAFGGSELIGLTVTETKDVERTLPKVIKSVLLRVVLFYTLPLLVITGLIPWNTIGEQGSPFVQVFSATGLHGAAHVMNFVLLTAVLSAANSGMYATSRMLHALAQTNEAPKLFGRLSRHGVPIWGILASGIALLLGTVVAYAAPEHVFATLMAIPGFTVLITWTCICLAQYKLRKQYRQLPSFHVRMFPFSTLLAAGVLMVVFVSFLFTGNAASTALSVGVVLFLLLLSQFAAGKR
ncbi:amino acid permease [Ectobacillus ponti]|uniref:Amino acid permease n=1 Tax=Ectobacillus ponti TaxID=2961894 RepID=A0AA41XA39_9BACI|nr:amino acid permease [Ectobacillus ponti]MCP8969083.1 amino acid permease [Ectobacillus ponti]